MRRDVALETIRRPCGVAGRRLLSATAALLACGSSLAADIPFRKDGDVTAGAGRVVLALVACLLVFAALLWLLRGHSLFRGVARRMPLSQMRVTQRARLSSKAGLAVVEFGGELHLVAHTDQHVVVVSRSPCLDAETARSPSKETQ